MNNRFLIHVEIADKSYALWIDRKDEELVREAAKQIRKTIGQLRQIYAQSETNVKDLLAMTALKMTIDNLQLKEKNDTSPFTEKIQELTEQLESFLKDK